MIIKSFKNFVNEDYSSEFDIESGFEGDGDDLSTIEDESTEDETSFGEEELEGSESGDVESFISELPKDILAKLASGNIDIVALACKYLDGGCEDDDLVDGEDLGHGLDPNPNEVPRYALGARNPNELDVLESKKTSKFRKPIIKNKRK